MKKSTILLLLTVFLSGCAMHSEPYILYSDNSRLLGDTSVFAVDIKDQPYIATIDTVDGKLHKPAGAGSAWWVRVLPGEHTFQLKYNIKVNGESSYNYYVVKLKMAPKRVYLATLIIKPGEAEPSYTVKELPEDEVYKMGLGLEGVNYQEFPAKFE